MARSGLRAFTQSGMTGVDFPLLFSDVYCLPDAGHGIAPSVDMAYVITDTCTKDELCVQACPVDCIHPKQDEAGFAEIPQLYVNPNDCIDCGACVPVCPTNSIFPLEEVPAEKAQFAELNAAHYN
jgi:NAD-dependent dihydropyrimidine dehydrogenase PreA subunit